MGEKQRYPRAVVFLALALLFLGFQAGTAQIREIEGTWDLSWDTPEGTRKIAITLHRVGMKVTGTALVPPAASPSGEATEVQVTHGEIAEDHLVFTVPLPTAGERKAMGASGGELRFNAVVGLYGVMGGVMTGEEMMQGMVTGAGAQPHSEVPFTGFKRQSSPSCSS